MIVQTIQRNVVESSDFKSEIATIDPQEMRYISSLLRNNYSKPILATVRETVANALDANSGANRPIEITCPSFQDPVFKVRDFGSGLSEEDLFGLYTKYGRSTKRNDNTCIGGFGIGRFAPLSYTDTFNVVSRNNGKEVIISVYVDEEGNTRFTKLGEQSYTGESGLEIVVAVKMGDLSQFKEAVAYCTCFLDKDFVLHGMQKINTKWTVKTDSWGHFSEAENDADGNHPCHHGASCLLVMGGVPYPVDLGPLITVENQGKIPEFISTIRNRGYSSSSFVFFVPVGSVSLHHSRESLEYNPRTKSFLINFFNKVQSEMLEDFQSNLSKFNDFWDFVDAQSKICANPIFRTIANREFVFTSASGQTFKSNCLQKVNDILIAAFSQNIRRRRSSSSAFKRINLTKENIYIEDIFDSKANNYLLVADERSYMNCINWIFAEKPFEFNNIFVVSKEDAEKTLLINHTNSKNILFVSKTSKIVRPKAGATDVLRLWKLGDSVYGNHYVKTAAPSENFYYVLIDKNNSKHPSNHEITFGRSRLDLRSSSIYHFIVETSDKLGIKIDALYGIYNELNLPPNAKNLFTEFSDKFKALAEKNEDILAKKAGALHYRSLLERSMSNTSNTVFRLDLSASLGKDHPLSKIGAKAFDRVSYSDDLQEKEIDLISSITSKGTFEMEDLPVDQKKIENEVMFVVNKYPMLKHLGWSHGPEASTDIINYIKFIDQHS